jgi:hypothetical protein
LPCLPGTACAKTGPSPSPTQSQGGTLCLPLCGISYVTPEDSGVDQSLVALMTRGMFA